jgi:nucleoid DNA-binding protein
MRVSVDYRSGSRDNYIAFCKKHPNIKVSFDQWRNIIYGFNESFKTYILETGLKARIPSGFGEFSITKKKRKRITIDPDGKEHINLPVDWKKSKEKGKKIYNFNFHTEGYFFGWMWFKKSTRIKNVDLWWFKPSRITSRLINHYIKADPKYQHLYQCWKP